MTPAKRPGTGPYTSPVLSLADTATGPDQPIPFTLTPKALAALDSGATATATDCGSGWACLRCGDAFFGAAPDDGLCPPCRAPRAVPGRTRP